jgi:hypothetical protein
MPNLSVNISHSARGPGRQPYAATGTGSFVGTAGRAYAWCLGRELQNVTSLLGQVYVQGVAAAGAGWAEIAVATGTFVPGSSNQTLTYRAYADIDAEVKAAASVMYGKTLTPSQPITTDQDIWIVVASSHASTQASWRNPSEPELTGLVGIKSDATGATTRPSLNIGTPLVFTGAVGSGSTVPFMKYTVIS